MQSRTALVIGAGIAGPVLALWLSRLGIRAVVLEARERASLVEGAFLGVAPNGMNALAPLGLAESVAASGHACIGFEFVNARGRRIGHIDRSEDRGNFGWPLTMLRRADLLRVLIGAAEDRGVELRFGARVERLEALADRARIVLTTGETLEADFAVGCDGLRSATRAALWPEAPSARDTRLIDCGGFARVDDLPFAPGINQMVFGRRAFFGAFTTPHGETWWFHNGPPTPHEPRAALLELHRDDPPWIAQLIRATPTVLGPWSLRELAPLSRWWRDRVCLIGDAAHAMSPSAGQGASLAFEDAMVLARCLRDHSEVQEAFARFELLRKPRVTAIAQQASRQSNHKVPGPIGSWFRDLVLPTFLRVGAKQQTRTYGHRLTWDAHVSD